MSQILGIGTDIVQVDRFKNWANFPKEKLLRVFSEKEFEDCCEKNLERLASRFAAKEAFFKALSSSLVNLKLTKKTFSFLFSCQNVEVIQDEWQVPQLNVNWESFEEKIGARLPKFQTHISISHEKNYSVAFVILSV